MNKYQESLDRLASINLDIIEDGETKLNQSIYGIHDRANLEMSGDLQTLQKLVDKETPMKPIENHYEAEGEPPYIKYICPKCKGKYQILEGTGYCFQCGQRLDWSDK